MKKSVLVYALIAYLILPAIVLVAQAHPGRTDANGGHTDRSTGEYHYHHGYSAHDHYDMDGDGVIDCPYDFVDRTNKNSGGSSGKSSPASGKSYSSNVKQATTQKIISNESEVEDVPSWIYWTIAILSAVVIIMVFIIRRKNKELSDQKNRFQQDAIEEEARVKNGIVALHDAITKKYGADYLYAISNAPDGDYVDNDLLPHNADYSVSPINDSYTFFLGSSPYNYDSKFHHSSCRYGRYGYKVNAYNLRKFNRYQSCAVCSSSKKLPDTEWVDEYLKHYKFLSKYVALHNDRQQ